jgi:hypothetical protein
MLDRNSLPNLLRHLNLALSFRYGCAISGAESILIRKRHETGDEAI